MVAGGRVEIDWFMRPDGFQLQWREREGPMVTPPANRGFGSRLLERGLAADLQGDVRLDFRPDGVVCRITAAPDGNRVNPPLFPPSGSAAG